MNDNHRDDFLPLDEALGFTPDDLTANREGRLSKRQVGRLRAREATSAVIGNMLALILMGGGLWLLSVGAVMLGGMLLILGAGLFMLRWFGRGRYSTEAKAGVIIAISGAMTLDTAEYKNPNGFVTEYRVTVADETFVISRDAFIALTESGAAAFTLYYLPTTRMILSAEPAA